MADFKVGDRVEYHNPHFADKRPTRHTVTAIRHDGGESGDQTMLVLDGCFGTPVGDCVKARIEYVYASDPPYVAMTPERIAALRRYLAADTEAFSEARRARKKWAPPCAVYDTLKDLLDAAERAAQTEGAR